MVTCREVRVPPMNVALPLAGSLWAGEALWEAIGLVSTSTETAAASLGSREQEAVPCFRTDSFSDSISHFMEM